MPNPPPFTLPPSTIPTSNMYPYNKLNQPQAQNPPASAGSSSVPTKSPLTAPPPKSPEVRSTQPTSSSGTARPFGAAGTEISELERQRRSGGSIFSCHHNRRAANSYSREQVPVHRATAIDGIAYPCRSSRSSPSSSPSPSSHSLDCTDIIGHGNTSYFFKCIYSPATPT